MLKGKFLRQLFLSALAITAPAKFSKSWPCSRVVQLGSNIGSRHHADDQEKGINPNKVVKTTPMTMTMHILIDGYSFHLSRGSYDSSSSQMHAQ